MTTGSAFNQNAKEESVPPFVARPAEDAASIDHDVTASSSSTENMAPVPDPASKASSDDHRSAGPLPRKQRYLDFAEFGEVGPQRFRELCNANKDAHEFDLHYSFYAVSNGRWGGTDKRAFVDDGEFRFPWTGNVMGPSDLHYLAGSVPTKLLAIVGPSNAGKTSLLAAMYLLFSRGVRPRDVEFSGSLTFEGWENIASSLRWSPTDSRMRFGLELDFPWKEDAEMDENTKGMRAPAAGVSAALSLLAPKQKTGRNEPCPCGSGLKYKRCCLP